MKRIWAAIVLTVVAAGLSRAVQHRDGRSITGVVIVTLDTTRADRLSPYGFMDVRMPHLERLAAEGVVFDQALTVAPLTLPAHASLFTGLLPPAHGVRDNADRPLAPAVTTLAEVLKSQGFRTAAFVGSVVLHADRGLAAGFDTYGDVPPNASGPFGRQRPGNEVVDEAVEWLERSAGSPFLLWTHLYDPHLPYDPPEPHRSAHSSPYVGELLFADSQVGRLLATLDRLELADRTIVIVAGDHGEGLGEHGEETHGQLLYDSVLRVPLIVRVPSVSPRRVADVVRLIDVMPTVLDLLDLKAPPSDGISLSGGLHGQRVDVEAYSETLYPVRMGKAPVHALRDGRFKLIAGPRPELYDLRQDPFEQQNVIDQRSRIATAMRGRLSALAARAASGLEVDVPAELRERLSALGYVAGTGSR